MDNQTTEAHDLIVQAREALRRGDKETARQLGEQAALLNPGLEDAWLILTAAEPNPEDALAYAQQALEIAPSSGRALKAVEWAIARLKQSQAAGTGAASARPAETSVAPVQEQPKLETAPAKKSNRWPWVIAAVALLLLLCALAVYAAYTGLTHPAFSSILSNVAVVPTRENLWAPMNLAKPGVNSAESIATTSPTPLAGNLLEQQAGGTPTARPAATKVVTSAPTETVGPAATEEPSSTPTEIATDAVTATPAVTETPGGVSMLIVEDTPTSQYVAPTSSAPLPSVASDGSGDRWIDVDLTNQRVYAYEGNTVVNSFIVSTGTWLHPTVTGQYNIYVKYRSAPMSGPGYYLPNVPYIMYFYKGYGLHGTYWHNNFGTPMSHGCVNLRTDEAAWLYNWSSVGTLVNIHY